MQSLRADLAVLGRSLEGFLASTVLFAVFGLLLGPVLVGIGMLLAVDLGLTVPLGLALLFAVVFALLPLAAVRREAPSAGRTSGTWSAPSSTWSR